MKKYLIAATPILLGIICFAANAIIGSEVAPDGTLIEPFFLIPVGYLLFFTGIISLLFVAIFSTAKKINIAK
ncbi:DUF3955 domain-containing protein [Lysinibacillus sphaericus]|uniref:DUF3955 domain-containing protein n=1 Tax=Lysinibacillus sphaericus OT4b.31 TaxID=1285586 RepID=R7ZDG9_LYSSH|nr:DUF3955 domain-containing protein [Lysinibacillus sphaericus]EON72172.1 hypothetical protein H131_12838 [Lysinibacillus sphaericus OT4b.31]